MNMNRSLGLSTSEATIALPIIYKAFRPTWSDLQRAVLNIFWPLQLMQRAAVRWSVPPG
jgi:hypothetical protein